MKPDVERSEGMPHNRATRLANACLDLLKLDPEYEGEKLIVFLDGEEVSSIGISGYEDDLEAMANLFMHLRAMFAAQGKELTLVGLAKTPGRG